MVRFILMDIEGTITELSFVRDILFPYAARHLPEFARRHAADPDVRAALEQIRQTMREENDSGTPGGALTDDDAIAQLRRWMTEDRKHTALKQLQGMVWKNGYENGAYRGHLYPDVLPALNEWKTQGVGLGIYSSGSAQAQKLLLKYSDFGDVTPLFSHYFDTRIGHKRDADAYARIASALAIPPLEILFLSDIAEELDAAAQAGFQVMQLVRGPETLASSYPQVSTFSDIRLESAGALC